MNVSSGRAEARPYETTVDKKDALIGASFLFELPSKSRHRLLHPPDVQNVWRMREQH
jgi:hypothetical protein